MVQHPCQASYTYMQGYRRSSEDKLKCVKILSVKGHNSAKLFRTWTRTLTKSERAPPRVCHYDSYFLVMTLNFDPLTSTCKGTFLSPSCIYVWNMKAVRWKLLKLSCQNQSVNKVQLWPWTLDSKCIDIFLSPFCIDVWNMKAVRWKLLKLSCQNQSVDKVHLWP